MPPQMGSYAACDVIPPPRTRRSLVRIFDGSVMYFIALFSCRCLGVLCPRSRSVAALQHSGHCRMGGRVAIFMAHLVNMSPAASHNFALLRTDWHCCSQSKNKRTFFGRTSHLTTLHSFCSRSLPTQCARERQEGSAPVSYTHLTLPTILLV